MTISVSSLSAQTRVNEDALDPERLTEVVQLAGGDYLVTFQASGHAYYRRFAADGTATGASAQVASIGSDVQGAALADGGFVLIWEQSNGLTYDFVGQRYDAVGNTVGATFKANTAPISYYQDVSIAGLQDGGFLAVWQVDGNPSKVGLQRFDSTGVKVGGEVQVTGGSPRALGLAGGGYVLQYTTTQGVVVEVFDASGASVTQSAGAYGELAARPDGGFVANWLSDNALYVQTFDASGAATSGAVRVDNIQGASEAHLNNSGASIAVAADGGFTLVWMAGPTYGPYALYSRQFDSAGQPVNDSAVVDTVGAGMPITTVLPGGDVVIVWSGDEIYQARISSSGEGPLSAGPQLAVGDGADDTFLAPPGSLGQGDQIDGQGGYDTVQLTAAGTLDFEDVTLSNVERVRGSAGDDTFIFDSASPSGLAFDSGGGSDTLQVTGEVDLSGFALTGSWTITSGGAKTVLQLGSVSQIPLIHGGEGPLTVDITDLDRPLTAAERTQLFQQGVDDIVDGDLVYVDADTAVAERVSAQRLPASEEQVWYSSLAGLADGDYVLVWGRSVQRFNADGSPDGPAYLLADTSANAIVDRNASTVVGLADGGYVAAWTQGAAYAQQFDAAGAPVGGLITVSNPGQTAYNVRAASLADGGYVLSWQNNDGTPGLTTQRYDSAGDKVGGQIALTAAASANLSVLSDGGFVTTWRDPAIGGDSANFMMQRFDAAGQTEGAETVIAGGEIGYSPVVVALPAGYAVIYSVWGAGEGVYVHIYDNDGALTAARAFSADYPSALMAIRLTDGDIVASWTNSSGVYVQRMSATGDLVGTPARFDEGSGLAALAENGYVLTSTDDGMLTQRTFAQSEVHSLTSGADSVAGAESPILIDVAPGTLDAADHIAGGSGSDVVRLARAGTYDLDTPATLQGFESLWGSSGDDVISISAARLAQFTTVDGGDGYDQLRLSSSGAVDLSGAMNLELFVGGAGDDTVFVGAARPGVALDTGGGTDTIIVSGVVDLGDVDLTGAWRITAADGQAATLILTDSSQVAWAWGLTSTITVDASAVQLSADQRQTLFDQGVDYIVQAEAVFTPAGGLSRMAPVDALEPANSASYAPHLARLGDGGYLAVWQATGTTSANDIFGQIHDASGAKVGSAFLINTTTADNQYAPDVATLAGGGLFVAWTSPTGTYGQRLDAAGAKVGGEVLISALSDVGHHYAAVTALGSGGFAVSWMVDKTTADEIHVQTFDATGAAVGAAQVLDGAGLSLSYVVTTALSDGGFVLAFDSRSTNFASDGDVYLQRFDSNGAVVGARVSIDADAIGAETQPAVAALADGGYIVAWVNDSIFNTGGLGIYVQRFDAAGAAVGDKVLVNTSTDDYQNNAMAVGLEDGGYIVAWNGGSFQRFDAEGHKVGGELAFGSGSSPSITLQISDLMAFGDGVIAGGYVSGVGAATQHFALLDLRNLTVNADTVAGDARDTWIIAHPDTLGAGDALSGGAGVDVFEQGAAGAMDLTAAASFSGIERLRGTGGDDTWIVSAAQLSGVTTITLGGGQDVLTLAAPGVLNLTGIAVSGVERILGTSGADTITGGAGADVIDGGSGNDVLKGGGGFDTVSYASAISAVSVDLRRTSAQDTGAAGTDTLSQFLGLTGSNHDDVLTGNGNGNTLDGGLGSDVLYGLAGNDVLRDGGETENRDFLYGGKGSDTYYVASSLTGPTDLVFEGGDNPDLMAGVTDIDVIYSAGSFFWDYYGVAERLYVATDAGSQLVGGTNSQQIFGSGGSDQIIAYGGSNRVDAGAGTDAVSFGLYGLDESYDGVNTLVMKAGNGLDYVYEFESGVDKIDLTAFHFGITGQQVLDQAVNVDQAGTANDYCYFYLTSAGGVDNYVAFIGLLSNQLQASDFIT